MDLSDRMRREVADVRADHARLVRVARARGLARQRRRRLLRTTGALVGAAAAVTATIAGTSWLVTQGGPPPAATAPAEPTVTTSQEPGEPVPATGRAVVAGLLELVPRLDGATVVPGSLGGDAGDTPGREAFGRVTLRTGGDEVVLGVTVQRLSRVQAGGGCAQAAGTCERTQLPDGDVLTTYRLDEEDLSQASAELVSERRDVRVRVDASNPTGAAVPLDQDRLGDLATWPGWDWELPASFADEVAAVPAFETPS